MAFAPEAPAAGGLGAAAVLGVIGLLALLGWMFARGSLYAWKYTIGWLLEGLADHLRIDVWAVHWDIGGPLRDLDHAVLGRLGAWAATCEHKAGYFFHLSAYVLEWGLYETAILARDTWQFGEWLVTKYIPRHAQAAAYAVFPPAYLARLLYNAIRREYPNVRHLISAAVAAGVGAITLPRLRTLESEFEALRKWLSRHKSTAAALGAIGGAIAFPWLEILPRLKQVERWVGRTNRRLRRLEALLGAAGMAAVMANALGLPNWRCITRGNIGRVSRLLCGLPSDLFAALLAGLLIVETPISLEQFAREMLDVEQEFGNLVLGVFSELDGFKV